MKIKTYPNPTSESFQINKYVESVSIFDLTGKEVKSFKGNFDKGHTFNISDLTPSICLVKINNNLDEPYTLKIVKLD
ncbi:T9SS type A sorting domain-containing protein [Gelatiniphilus marinus]|uniref:T9SS type A sorting domain-containing protein n=1 Tax=Gelatiniphilus marinus TaxID=1759464 RepID=A0ABW5JMM3_9FLAO